MGSAQQQPIRLILAVSLLVALGDRAVEAGAAGRGVPADPEGWAAARQFWAFQPPEEQPLPEITHRAWPRGRVDHFILSRLEQQGLAPSPETDPIPLIRRLSLGLTGLPPTPDEVAEFLADTTGDAYERVVDRLLDSPNFGERLASLWMNVARYAEDQAHQVGNDRSMFYPNAHLYRAWVIDAFNRDLPYNQFVQLQLAADLNQSTNNLAALGFIGLGPKYYNRGRIEVMADEWEDRVDTVTRSFLGLTVACARCHDHKYDPITTKDYHALAGIFASIKLVNADADGRPIEKKKGEDKDKDKDKIDPAMLHIVKEDDPKDLNVFIRGDVKSKGDLVPRRFLRVLCEGEPKAFTEGSGRGELAEAIIDPGNPLTARVMVNRLWTLVFGRGLVATPSNFGEQGGRPTHPELLDDLAARFREGWSVKRMVKELVLSSTYRQDSALDPARVAADEDNQFWWRMDRRRLTVEQWRDSVLFVAGNLDGSGGSSLELSDPDNLRRTVYARVSRLQLDSMLSLFDYPDANVHNSGRPSTTTATQKLFILNSDFMIRQSRVLAQRILDEPAGDDQDRIAFATRLVYSRPPTPTETELALAFLNQEPNERLSRWQQYAQVLLASNEMMYVD